MAEGSGVKGAPHPFTDEELAWMGEHLTEMRSPRTGSGSCTRA
jgi:hypothetical protein